MRKLKKNHIKFLSLSVNGDNIKDLIVIILGSISEL